MRYGGHLARLDDEQVFNRSHRQQFLVEGRGVNCRFAPHSRDAQSFRELHQTEHDAAAHTVHASRLFQGTRVQREEIQREVVALSAAAIGQPHWHLPSSLLD